MGQNLPNPRLGGWETQLMPIVNISENWGILFENLYVKMSNILQWDLKLLRKDQIQATNGMDSVFQSESYQLCLVILLPMIIGQYGQKGFPNRIIIDLIML